MSRSEAKMTKRRKVWAIITTDGSISTTAWRKDDITKAAQQRYDSVSPIQLVEARPGDVVLSREDADWLRQLLDDGAEYSDRGRRVLALLRGGR